MARINVEDSLLLDARFQALERKLPRFIAKGAWVEISKVAQNYWKDNKKLIPKNVWELGDYPKEFIECGIVIEKENGFYLIGSEKEFAWLVAQVENGKKGGRPRVSDGITKPTGYNGYPMANPPTPTPTPTPTQIHNTYRVNENTKPFSFKENLCNPIQIRELLKETTRAMNVNLTS